MTLCSFFHLKQHSVAEDSSCADTSAASKLDDVPVDTRSFFTNHASVPMLLSLPLSGDLPIGPMLDASVLTTCLLQALERPLVCFHKLEKHKTHKSTQNPYLMFVASRNT